MKLSDITISEVAVSKNDATKVNITFKQGIQQSVEEFNNTDFARKIMEFTPERYDKALENRPTRTRYVYENGIDSTHAKTKGFVVGKSYNDIMNGVEHKIVYREKITKFDAKNPGERPLFDIKSGRFITHNGNLIYRKYFITSDLDAVDVRLDNRGYGESVPLSWLKSDVAEAAKVDATL